MNTNEIIQLLGCATGGFLIGQIIGALVTRVIEAVDPSSFKHMTVKVGERVVDITVSVPPLNPEQSYDDVHQLATQAAHWLQSSLGKCLSCGYIGGVHRWTDDGPCPLDFSDEAMSFEEPEITIEEGESEEPSSPDLKSN